MMDVKMLRRGLTEQPAGQPPLHLRRCQNTACRVDTYLAAHGHVAMLSCPCCPVSGVPVAGALPVLQG